MWKRLRHPNIVPLLGITLEPLQLISAWMPGGELKEYIAKNSDVDQLGLVGIPFLLHRITLTLFPVIWDCRWSQLPSLPQHGPRGSQGGA